jgi:hypothetical protein
MKVTVKEKTTPIQLKELEYGTIFRRKSDSYIYMKVVAVDGANVVRLNTGELASFGDSLLVMPAFSFEVTFP